MNTTWTAKVVWNYQAPEGSKDTHYAILRGTKANLVVKQGKEQNYRPELYIEPAKAGDNMEELAKAGAKYIAFHIEPVYHIHRVIKRIKDSGAKAGVALNPGTPLSVLDPILEDIDIVVLMAINPGIVGHKLIPSALDKIAKLKKMVANRSDFIIQIDGGVTPESAPKMVEAGANMLVCGTSTIYKKWDEPLDERLGIMRDIIDKNISKK